MIGAATKEGYWPRQLITEVPQVANSEEEHESSDNEQENVSNTWTI